MAAKTTPTGASRPSGLPPLRRVQSSYIQVADQLRDLILRGDLAVGQKLPSEAEMAPLLGVSRSTIREALRILTTEHLIETRRGIQGGAFVAVPDSERLEGMFNTSFSMLALTNQVDARSFLQAMRALEGPAAALAAAARGGDQVEELKRTAAMVDPADQEAAMQQSADFHSAILRASGNKLLEAMGRPVSAVARSKFRRTVPGLEFWERNQRAHQELLKAILAGDENLAYELATRHIDEDLSPYYLPPEEADRDGAGA
ncbi:FadR/GntR family transcriptional regulator [Mycolicibacterium thermoresistibile]|uniref:GntR domain protein n=1 Tax=Mycolicibacterium thermoresistibile TaxID=1797 RepID=A0A100XGF9_MYCTH|nr:FCD domain-containing protein [Mycolicibacterium thermoresistibile]MCV7187899.1 FadR family transcriptional regulator [Mycolicibacterium thermoresistibile]GAT16038.1 GntR domain protein [Mycolicibacterium thermoresistibile]SNW16997.1 GntR family transcriptional regulator [Mycolicibacterium thermoresistibile]